MKQRLIIGGLFLIVALLSITWLSILLDNQKKPNVSEKKIAQLEQRQFKSVESAADAIESYLYPEMKYKGITYGGGSGNYTGVLDYTVRKKKHYITNFYIMNKAGNYHVVIGKTDQRVTYHVRRWTDKVDQHLFKVMTGSKEKLKNADITEYQQSFSAAIGEETEILVYEK